MAKAPRMFQLSLWPRRAQAASERKGASGRDLRPLNRVRRCCRNVQERDDRVSKTNENIPPCGPEPRIARARFTRSELRERAECPMLRARNLSVSYPVTMWR